MRDFRNVYQVRFDLAKDGIISGEPCEERLVVALDFDEAYDIAAEIKNDLRPTAVYKELIVRDITLVHAGVIVMKEK